MTSWEEDMKAYHNLLYEICFKDQRTSDLASKYNKSEGYISQLKKKISQLKFKPQQEDGELICTKCGIKVSKLYSKIAVHHVHRTGELIALLCNSCNPKMGDNDNLNFRYHGEEYNKTVDGEIIRWSNDLDLDTELCEIYPKLRRADLLVILKNMDKWTSLLKVGDDFLKMLEDNPRLKIALENMRIL